MLTSNDLSNTMSLLYFSLVAFMIFSIMLVVFLCVLHSQNIKQKSNITKMLKKIDLITSASVGMGQRLIELESKIVSLRDVQDEFKDKDLDFSYGRAHKLISQGLSSDTVAANSGLSVSEVSLMELMHQEGKS